MSQWPWLTWETLQAFNPINFISTTAKQNLGWRAWVRGYCLTGLIKTLLSRYTVSSWQVPTVHGVAFSDTYTYCTWCGVLRDTYLLHMVWCSQTHTIAVQYRVSWTQGKFTYSAHMGRYSTGLHTYCRHNTTADIIINNVHKLSMHCKGCPNWCWSHTHPHVDSYSSAVTSQSGSRHLHIPVKWCTY